MAEYPEPTNPNTAQDQTLDPSTFPTPNVAQSLLHWLKPRLPPDTVTLWGTKPGTKNVYNLWLELTLGEATLSNSTPLLYTVHCVLVVIRNTTGDESKYLIESCQLLSDGTMQPRLCPLTVRMKTGESIKEAALRAIKGEIGSEFQRVTVEEAAQFMFRRRQKNEGSSSKTIEDTGEEFRSKLQLGNKAEVAARVMEEIYQREEKKRASREYPGLIARYVTHQVDAEIDGLPEGAFSTQAEEFGECNEYTEATEKALCVVRRYWKWTERISWDNVRANSKFLSNIRPEHT